MCSLFHWTTHITSIFIHFSLLLNLPFLFDDSESKPFPPLIPFLWNKRNHFFTFLMRYYNICILKGSGLITFDCYSFSKTLWLLFPYSIQFYGKRGVWIFYLSVIQQFQKNIRRYSTVASFMKWTALLLNWSRTFDTIRYGLMQSTTEDCE